MKNSPLQGKMALNPNPDGYKKCVAMRLGVLYDSQLAEIYKTQPQTGGSSYFFVEKSPKTEFFW